jgi:hypothetical protein
MGCTSFQSISEINDYQQESIKLDMSNNIKGLSHANSLIKLITRIRNKIIYLYHKLIYDTGACIFIKPNIAQCLKCILYKVSSEFEGKLENANIQHRDDPPYLVLSKEIPLSDKSLFLFNELFNFIIEIISYKTIIKQIDKETPELLYLIYESKNKLSNKNIELINKGMELFKNIKSIKYEILSIYKNQVYEFVYRKSKFYEEINEIGRYAYENNITDIYEIAYIQKDFIKNDNNKNEMKMFKSVYNAKVYMENIINNEKNDDIIESHESIIENLDESNINENK